MTTAYQLPDDVGQKSIVIDGKEVQAEGDFPTGQKSSSESLPIVLSRDKEIPIVDNYRIITEVDNDLLGFPRSTTPWSFLSKTDTFELSESDWCEFDNEVKFCETDVLISTRLHSGLLKQSVGEMH